MRLGVAALAFLSLSVLAPGYGVSQAKRRISPRAGQYVGRVTNANGRGGVRLVVATFVPRPGAKPRFGPQLFRWTGVLTCDDGSSRDVGPEVFAPVHGVRFSGRVKKGARTVTLRGRFTADGRLKGIARVVTTGAAPAGRCSTGAVALTAHHR